MLKDILPIMQLQDLVFIFGLFTVILATILERLPIKINPWTQLFRMMGRTANHDILKRQDDIEESFKKTCERIDAKINQIEKGLELSLKEIHEHRAIETRRRILVFANRLQENKKYSRECFDGIMEDIREYQKYCEKNKDFKNDKAVISIEVIEEDYKRRLKTNDFLEWKGYDASDKRVVKSFASTSREDVCADDYSNGRGGTASFRN